MFRDDNISTERVLSDSRSSLRNSQVWETKDDTRIFSTHKSLVLLLGPLLQSLGLTVEYKNEKYTLHKAQTENRGNSQGNRM
jgi:hypothetical protein